ncbi:MAG: Holliday junction branch migration protein RuvA [Candidatus Pacebacteria bacterium]|jgi:Holliday junction DNA helicase RuvA|nr:Holliday junction branch migration protein RuvA [bacterium]MDP6527984.1 Holliday junction branch migration protein RuvA [Candidatus Paceibacterota bacterium]MDP6659758.1 Holliday junction branch migration protein RuvA [Candidatus Paceibacterota bacterium]|tara:strand:- start:12687 stop:13259 length:573 start_codon:yes stop_codon:yes gene_type:complete
MIAKLTGEIVETNATSVVVDVSGVGYRVFVTSDALNSLKKESGAATLHTHLAVRENSQDIYGFTNKDELVFFELLLSVSGIGPKSALAILSLSSVEAIRSAVLKGDTSYLTKVSGIGKKNAEKIVLELSDKLGAIEGVSSESFQGDVDALEALTTLGYSQNEARDALKNVPKEFESTNDRLKEALKSLGK